MIKSKNFVGYLSDVSDDQIRRNTLATTFLTDSSSEITDGNRASEFTEETKASEISDGQSRRKFPTESSRRFSLTSTIPTIFVGRNIFRQITDNVLPTKYFVGIPSDIWPS